MLNPPQGIVIEYDSDHWKLKPCQHPQFLYGVREATVSREEQDPMFSINCQCRPDRSRGSPTETGEATRCKISMPWFDHLVVHGSPPETNLASQTTRSFCLYVGLKNVSSAQKGSIWRKLEKEVEIFLIFALMFLRFKKAISYHRIQIG